MAISVASLNDFAPERDNRRIVEYWEVTGSTGAAGDTAVITCRDIRVPKTVLGPFSYTINGNQVTIKALAALGSDKALAQVIGDAGSSI